MRLEGTGFSDGACGASPDTCSAPKAGGTRMGMGLPSALSKSNVLYVTNADGRDHTKRKKCARKIASFQGARRISKYHFLCVAHALTFPQTNFCSAHHFSPPSFLTHALSLLPPPPPLLPSTLSPFNSHPLALSRFTLRSTPFSASLSFNCSFRSPSTFCNVINSSPIPCYILIFRRAIRKSLVA